MAYITASPNPVGVYSATFGAYASLVWDVQDGPNEVRASEVAVSINGGPSQPVQGPGVFGRFVYPVAWPNSYEFILRYADTKSELTGSKSRRSTSGPSLRRSSRRNRARSAATSAALARAMGRRDQPSFRNCCSPSIARGNCICARVTRASSEPPFVGRAWQI